MTTITVIPTSQVLEESLAMARQAGARAAAGVDRSGLNAPVNAALRGRIEDAWDSIQSLLRRTFERGTEAMHGLIEATVMGIQKTIEDAGALGSQVYEALLERLHTFARQYIERMLTMMPAVIRIGDTDFTLSTVKLTHKLSMQGSLKASITELVAMLATGEIEVGTDYVRPTHPIGP